MPSTTAPVVNLRVIRSLLLCVALALGTPLHATGRCDSEVKLLLQPDEIAAATKAFELGPATKRSIYFFDTPDLELLSRGVIIRARLGGRTDLVVKLRMEPNETTAFEIPESATCDFDIIDGVVFRSYSVQTKLKTSVPATGTQLLEALSPAQTQLLQRAHLSVDWGRVKPKLEIQSTLWQVRGQPAFPRLVLELWEWPSGSALEVSARVAGRASTDSYTRLQQLIAAKNLQPNHEQKPKTTIALQSTVTSK